MGFGTEHLVSQEGVSHLQGLGASLRGGCEGEHWEAGEKGGRELAAGGGGWERLRRGLGSENPCMRTGGVLGLPLRASGERLGARDRTNLRSGNLTDPSDEEEGRL